MYTLLLFLFLEAFTHNRHVRQVPLRILVNGTRGKTTVTRQLYSTLKVCGFNVLAKTTGSEALIINPDGTEKPVSRRFGYHLIREQYKFFALASKLKVDAVVVECSAVSAEAQSMLQRLVKPTVSIITNARVDHVDQMGSTKASTSEVLKLSVPNSARFYTSDSYFENDPQALVVKGQNDALVQRVMADLGFASCPVQPYTPDLGLVGPFQLKDILFVNAFAANDKESAAQVLDQYKDQDYVVLYNNRKDREFRVPYFAELFASYKVKQVYVLGEHVNKCVRFFSKHVPGAKVGRFDNAKLDNAKLDNANIDNVKVGSANLQALFSLNCKIVLGMGNIKGAGLELVKACMKEVNNA